MNLPNSLTVARMLLIPVFLWLYTQGQVIGALIVYLVAALTDALDGYLARTLKQITAFGKTMDPLADKLMQLSMLCCLAYSGHVPKWFLYTLLGKDAYLVLGSFLMYKMKRLVVWATLSGKIATCLLIGGVVLVYPWHEIAWLRLGGEYFLYAGLAFAIFSAGFYTLRAVRMIKGEPVK